MAQKKSAVTVEVEPPWLVWRKSSMSWPEDCVEAAMTAESVHVRDSKNRAGARLTFSRQAWSSFLEKITEIDTR